MQRIKIKWQMDKNNHLEHDALVDISAATKVSLKGVQLSEEKNNKFRGQFRTMVLDVLVKLRKKHLFTMQSFVVHQVYHLEI